MGSSSSISTSHLSKTLFFSGVPDDILINILCRLDEDPRDLARLACVSTRFCRVIKRVCWKLRCEKTIPLLVSELLQGPSSTLKPFAEPPGGWASLQKLLVCCPGLWHAGVLLESWDFGLDREIGWFDKLENQDGFSPARVTSEYTKGAPFNCPPSKKARNKQATSTQFSMECAAGTSVGVTGPDVNGDVDNVPGDTHGMAEVATCICSCGNKETVNGGGHELEALINEVVVASPVQINMGNKQLENKDQEQCKECHRHKSDKRQREFYNEHCHVATGPWNLTREQGNKLLANRFRADSLYICDWPGCIHPGDKRIYKLFRGVFKNFKSSHVWRNLKDMQAKASNVGCAFCVCKSTWDMVTTFCLKRSIEFHDDGEPVVRAYVCENGHVSGAWTDRPMYTL